MTGDAAGSPSALELVTAVREFLERDVMDATEGRVQFHARVAVNVLGIVERELATGASLLEELQERLRAAGYSSEAELAAAIRRRDVTIYDAAGWEAAVAGARVRLELANPDYETQPESSGN